MSLTFLRCHTPQCPHLSFFYYLSRLSFTSAWVSILEEEPDICQSKLPQWSTQNIRRMIIFWIYIFPLPCMIRVIQLFSLENLSTSDRFKEFCVEFFIKIHYWVLAIIPPHKKFLGVATCDDVVLVDEFEDALCAKSSFLWRQYLRFFCSLRLRDNRMMLKELKANFFYSLCTVSFFSLAACSRYK